MGIENIGREMNKDNEIENLRQQIRERDKAIEYLYSNFATLMKPDFFVNNNTLRMIARMSITAPQVTRVISDELRLE